MKYVMTLFLLGGATLWVGAKYIGAGGAGINLEARTERCVVNSQEKKTACATTAAAALSSLDDGNQDGSPRTDFAGAASPTQSAWSFGVEEDGALSENPPRYIEDTGFAPTAGFTETNEGENTDYEEPQYVGEYIDPDTDDFQSLSGTDMPIYIGKDIDPDSENSDAIPLNVLDQKVGEFKDPAVNN